MIIIWYLNLTIRFILPAMHAINHSQSRGNHLHQFGTIHTRRSHTSSFYNFHVDFNRIIIPYSEKQCAMCNLICSPEKIENLNLTKGRILPTFTGRQKSHSYCFSMNAQANHNTEVEKRRTID